jgi:hypothetical protein
MQVGLLSFEYLMKEFDTAGTNANLMNTMMMEQHKMWRILALQAVVVIVGGTLLYTDSPSTERAARVRSLLPVSSLSSLKTACRPSSPGRHSVDSLKESGEK